MTAERRELRFGVLRAALVLAGVSVIAVGCAIDSDTAPAGSSSAEPPPAAAQRSASSAQAGSAGGPLDLASMASFHRYRDSVAWRIGRDGIEVQGGQPPADKKRRDQIIERVWRDYGTLITQASDRHGVPAELLIAIIMEESAGRPNAILHEPGYVSDAKTPNKITLGLTGVLLGTARKVMDNPRIDRRWLYDPANAIEVSARYVAQQYSLTGYDPVKVAAAYNAGDIYYDGSRGNRWKMLTYPKGHSKFIDNFVTSFNMATAYLRDGRAPARSFAMALK